MKKNNLIIILFLLLIVNTDVFSQSTTNSPYSKYGVGLLRKQTFTRSFGMGGAGIGLRSDRDIGLINPASYSALRSVTFDVENNLPKNKKKIIKNYKLPMLGD